MKRRHPLLREGNVRGLLRGEEVTYRGRVLAVERVRLDYRPPRPNLAIFMAAVGERSLALCGEITDGLIVSNMLPSGYARQPRQSSARPPPRPAVPCPRSCNACLASRADRDEARRIVKPPHARAAA
jgi:alkanesulfonate monooxygenase SsuD/methylene tetrahydromethanopterin reductase-like flavin-dependent oxidoreductase (luciferase family)